MMTRNYNDIFEKFQKECYEIQAQNLTPQELYCTLSEKIAEAYDKIYFRLFNILEENGRNYKNTDLDEEDYVAEMIDNTQFTEIEKIAIIMSYRDDDCCSFENVVEMFQDDLTRCVKWDKVEDNSKNSANAEQAVTEI